MKVDVVVCTYNSEKILDKCLRSIVSNIPINSLYVIDNFSTDKTKTISLGWGAEVIESDRSLAEARALSFRIVKTPMFVNVDSDLVLCEDWFKKIFKFWNKENIGAISGIHIDQHPLHKAYMESMFKFRSSVSYNIPKLPNMLARKDLLEDIVFPERITKGSIANEDFLIKKWIEKKGFKWLLVPVFSKHYSNPPQHEKATWQGASIRISRVLSFKNLIYKAAFSVPQGLATSFISRNPLVFPYWVKFRLKTLYGFLNWRNYYDLKR